MSDLTEALDALRDVRARSRAFSHLRQPAPGTPAREYPASHDRALWDLLDAVDAALAPHQTVTADDGALLDLPDDLTTARYGYRLYGVGHGPLGRDELVTIAGQYAHDVERGASLP